MAACWAANGVPLRGSRGKPREAGALPGESVSLAVGDGHDGVVEGGLHVDQSVRNILALALLETFLFLAALPAPPGFLLLLCH